MSSLNTTGLWTHWAGYLSAVRYAASAKHEYFAVRNSVGVFDTSPLYKCWVRGPDAERFLAGVLIRDVRRCRPGQALYTVWCDDRGFVLEDGVVFRHSETEFLLTSAEPNVGYLSDLAGRLDVRFADVTDDYGMLAIQGPRSRELLVALAPQVGPLAAFEHSPAKISGAAVTVSRTGYTGDLGYELLVRDDDAPAVLDAVLEAGAGRGLRPFGEQALLMLRVEAGLLLRGSDYHSSRLASTDEERVTPAELGLGWMLRQLDDDRAFIGRSALRRERDQRTSRWTTTGLVLDWEAYDRVYADAGVLPVKDENPTPYESLLYDDDGTTVGYATSLMYSPVLQRTIALARVRPAAAARGRRVHVELMIHHRHHTVPAELTTLPLYDPARRTERFR